MEYSVTITKYHYYTVEADSEEEAEEIAVEEFEHDMERPWADKSYDDVEVEEIEDDEEDEDD